MLAIDIHNTLKLHENDIKDFSYVTQNVWTLWNETRQSLHADTANQYSVFSYTNGVSPSSYLDSQIAAEWQTDRTGLGLTEQLYTARGSQGEGLEKKWADLVLANPADEKSLFLQQIKWGSDGNFAIPVRPLFTAKYVPKFMYWRSTWDSWAVTSIPLVSLYSNVTIDETWLYNVYIQMNDPDDHSTIDALATRLELNAPYCTVDKAYDQGSTTTKVKKILDKVFYGLISVTMFLCFFSLCASMSANLYEQKKEVGILRAMGFTKYRVRALYFYESLVLVLSSCTLGVLIGTVVGYTMLLQFNLFLHANVEPFFPWA